MFNITFCDHIERMIMENGPLVGIEITKKCNFKCPHCFTDSKIGRKREMSLKTMTELLRDLKACGVTNVALTGGEPFLRKDLPEIFRFAKEIGMKMYLVTNGSLCSRDNLKELALNNLFGVQVSLDGPDPETNSEIRACPSKSFDSAVETMRICHELGIYVSIGIFLHKNTIDRFDEFVKLAQSIPVSGIRYASFLPIGRGDQAGIIKAVQPSLKQLKIFFAKVITYNGSNPKIRVAPDCATGPYYPAMKYDCGAGKEVIYIDSKGDVYPCTTLLFDVCKIGNIYDRPLKGLIADASDYCKTIPDKKSKTGMCSKCNNLNCFGGCPAVIYAYHHRFDQSLPFCVSFKK